MNQYTPIGDWESYFNWNITLTQYGKSKLINMKNIITRELLKNKYEEKEFYVDVTDNMIALVFLYETPDIVPYTKKSDVIVKDCINSFINNQWISHTGINGVCYNHEILVTNISPMHCRL